MYNTYLCYYILFFFKYTNIDGLFVFFRRSKMYSGKVTGLAYVPTLYEACIRVLQENIDGKFVTIKEIQD